MKKSIFVRNQLARDGFEIKKKTDKWVIYKDGKPVDREKVIELDNRVFPFTAQTAQTAWSALLEKSGAPFNEKDDNPRLKYSHYRYHLHCLRKFWFHSFQNTAANKNHIDFMGGHQSLLDSTYTNFLQDVDKLKETYDKHSVCLTIFESQPYISDINEQLKEKDERISDLEKKTKDMDDIKMQLLELRLTIQELKDQKNKLTPFLVAIENVSKFRIAHSIYYTSKFNILILY